MARLALWTNSQVWRIWVLRGLLALGFIATTMIDRNAVGVWQRALVILISVDAAATLIQGLSELDIRRSVLAGYILQAAMATAAGLLVAGLMPAWLDLQVALALWVFSVSLGYLVMAVDTRYSADRWILALASGVMVVHAAALAFSYEWSFAQIRSSLDWFALLYGLVAAVSAYRARDVVYVGRRSIETIAT